MSLATLPVPLDERAPAPRLAVHRRTLAAAVEIVLVAGFYQWYSLVRHLVAGSTAAAQRHAMHVVSLERALGIFNESTAQAAVLAHHAVLRAAATYYGTAHFIVPAVALVVLYGRDRARYVTWRNALAWTSAIAVGAFALFPTMPPRFLPAAFHFTNVVGHGVDRPLVPALYNGYAAMPSLHAAYAIWAAAALWPVVRSRWVRALLVTHFVTIVAVVIVTGNHFYIDVAGGVAVAVVGIALARRRARRPALTNAWVAIGLVLGAAVLIWLPRAATLPLALDAAAAAAVAALVVTQPEAERIDDLGRRRRLGDRDWQLPVGVDLAEEGVGGGDQRGAVVVPRVEEAGDPR